MIDSIIRAWALAAADDFGGSLDEDIPLLPFEEPRRIPSNRGRCPPSSGVRYCYPCKWGYQVKIPGVKSKLFRDIDAARAYVAQYAEIE